MWKETDAKTLNDNMIKMISDEFMLISAGDNNKFNMMTASWGFMGEAWGNDAVAILVRPERYTMEFIDKNDRFSLSFYGDNKAVHKVCGSKSGRDCDKAKEAGLTPVFSDDTVYFEEARTVFICKKQYVCRLEEQHFTDDEPKRWYPEKDWHFLIIGKIEKTLVKE